MKEADLKQTPSYILDRVTATLGPWFDPCPVNPTFDGLRIRWPNLDFFINPPYSRGELERWGTKAWREYIRVFSETDEPINGIWLINYGATANRRLIKSRASAICDLYERISFVDQKTGETLGQNDRDSTLYLWGWKVKEFREAFSDIGVVFVKPS